MKSALPVVIALACWMQGCQRPSESAQVAEKTSALSDTLVLELTKGKLSRYGLVQEYQISNFGPNDVYFICPEASCGDPGRALVLPFYELSEGSLLSIYGYFAHKPRLEPLTEQPYYKYAVKRIAASGVYHGTVEIKPPLKSNPPYPHSAYQPHLIDGIVVDRVRLTLGVLPCPDANLQPDEDDPSGEVLRLHERKRIQCGSATGEARDFQKLIAAEARIVFTGCWPNWPRAGRLPTPCEEEDDAGR